MTKAAAPRMTSTSGAAPRERMSRVDTAWLRMDNDVNLMMIVGVWLLTPAIDYETLCRRVEERLLRYDRFRHVVLLSAPLDILLERVSSRTNNPYGRTPEQRAEIERYLETVEPLLRRRATVELDGQRPVSKLTDLVEVLATRKH